METDVLLLLRLIAWHILPFADQQQSNPLPGTYIHRYGAGGRENQMTRHEHRIARADLGAPKYRRRIYKYIAERLMQWRLITSESFRPFACRV